MPKRKPGTNAFFFFMQDFKVRHNLKSNADAAVAAGPHWNKLPEEQKKVYKDKANALRANQRGRMTSDGMLVDDLCAKHEEKQIMLQEMKDKIQYSIQIACQVGGIAQKDFFLVHLNLLLPDPVHGVYYPSEIGVSVFNLQDGVQDVFHRIVEPGQLPLGYAGDAKAFSDNSHQMYDPSSFECNNNMEKVYTDLIQFIEKSHKSADLWPVLFTDEKIMYLVNNVLNEWSLQFGNGFVFKVYSLQYMLRVLKNTCLGAKAWFSDTPSIKTIDKDVYSFTTGICCKFHEQTDVIHKCSRSFVVRYAYLVCDICCGDLNIPLRPGCHIPNICKTVKASSISSFGSRNSSVIDDSSSISSYTSSTRGDDTDDDSVCPKSTDTDDDTDDGFQVPSSRRKNAGVTQNVQVWPRGRGFRRPDTASSTGSNTPGPESRPRTSLSESTCIVPKKMNSKSSFSGAWNALASTSSTDCGSDFPTLGAKNIDRGTRVQRGYAGAVRGKPIRR